MLPTRHAALGAVAALALTPWLRWDSLGMWAGSVFIDADHYAWYVLRRRDLSLRRAYRYFRQVRSGERRLEGDARPLHGPVNIAWMALLAWRWPAFRAIFLGVLVHALLDAYAERRLNALLPLGVRAT